MHTIVVTLIGLVLLGIFVGTAREKTAAARRFIPVWLILCFIHLGYGVVVDGYGLLMELGVHALVFGVPSVAASGLSRVLQRKT